MLTFLLKFTACLAILMIFYKVMLERESVHHFKRFFLLGALLASFIIPNLVFIEYIDAVEPTINSITPRSEPISDAVIVNNVPQASIFDWQLLLWLIYGLGVIGFGLRFIANLFRIRSRIKKNPKFKENFVTKVLLNQTLPPHTFLNYIFLNQKQHEENSIPQEVLLHEETHAKQRHSLDIMLIELVQVVFWFNPLIYLVKSSIKLNHEFLADKAVINKEQNHSHYQNTLLSYLSNEKHQSVGIANAINYSSIKKRFTIMKTNTSKKSFVLRSLLLLPLTALLLFGFSEHRQIEREVAADHIISMELLGNERVQIQNDIVHFDEVAQTLKQEYLSTYDSEETKVEITADQPVHLNTINNLSKEIRTTGIDLIEVFANEVIMDKDEYKENVPITSTTTKLHTNRMTMVENNTRLSANRNEMTSEPVSFEIQAANSDKGLLLTCKDGCNWKELFFTIKSNQIKYIDQSGLTNSQKSDVFLISVQKKDNKLYLKGLEGTAWKELSFSLTENKIQNFNQLGMWFSKKDNQQQSATREEMKEYNALAKKYNEMDRNHMLIKKSEVMRLKTIYGKMSKKQQADAEPFPDFPPAPPAPGAPEPPLDAQEVIKLYPNNPPAPPAPPKPVEHIKEMVAKGASFTLNGKEISGKKAIEVVQKNKHINIDAREAKGAKPIVKLSTDPIVIEN